MLRFEPEVKEEKIFTVNKSYIYGKLNIYRDQKRYVLHVITFFIGYNHVLFYMLDYARKSETYTTHGQTEFQRIKSS